MKLDWGGFVYVLLRKSSDLTFAFCTAQLIGLSSNVTLKVHSMLRRDADRYRAKNQTKLVGCDGVELID